MNKQLLFFNLRNHIFIEKPSLYVGYSGKYFKFIEIFHSKSYLLDYGGAETVFFLPPAPSPPPFLLVFVLQLFFSFRFCCLSFFCILDLPYRLRFLFPHIFLFDWIEWIENLAKDERETGPSDHKAEDGGNIKAAGYFCCPK